MHLPRLFLIAAFSLALLPSAHSRPPSRAFYHPCRYGCRFTLCTGTTRLLLTMPNTGMLPRLCLPGSYLGRVLRTGEPRVSRSGMGHAYPISKWRPSGLWRPFPRDAFFAKEIRGMDASGVARRHARGNQHAFLAGVCVVLPIREWEVMNEGGEVVRSRRGGKGDCVSFRAVAARVVVELRWYSGDDLDLVVTEPDGDKVGVWKRSSESGMLWADEGVDMCGVGNMSGEKAVWQVAELVQSGRYRVKVKVGGLCEQGGAKWTVGVSVGGKMVKKVKGEIGGQIGEVVPGSVFQFSV